LHSFSVASILLLPPFSLHSFSFLVFILFPCIHSVSLYSFSLQSFSFLVFILFPCTCIHSHSLHPFSCCLHSPSLSVMLLDLVMITLSQRLPFARSNAIEQSNTVMLPNNTINHHSSVMITLSHITQSFPHIPVPL
jgi:hypothetical protein